MNKQKTGNEWHGWLVLDKPLGITSAAAVGKVKRLLKPKKIGHGGTLDPLASGILPLALGEATKAFQFVAQSSKTYRFTIRWGEERSTDDAEGEVVASNDARPSREEILAALPQFHGEIQQAPPAFSAIKVDGQRSYARARGGEVFELDARPVQVDTLELLSIDDADHATFEMTCGKGTYVRSIARDLGRNLACFGHVSMLRRTRVGKFTENRSISLEKLEHLVHIGALNEQLLPIASVLDDIPVLELDPKAADRLRHGNPVMIPPLYEDGTLVRAEVEGELIAIAKVAGDELRSVRVFLA